MEIGEGFMTNVKFTVALLGKGPWGNVLKKHFDEDERFKLKYICNSKSNLSEVFRDLEVDVVVVATPDKTHAGLVLSALNHNKHIFCEKPLALNYHQCLLIKNAAKNNGKIVLTDYIYTFSKGLKYIQELINAGTLGRLESIDLVSKQLSKIEDDNVSWVLGSHMLSILGMFMSLENSRFVVKSTRGKQMTLNIIDDSVVGKVTVSLDSLERERKLKFQCEEATVIFEPMINKILITYENNCKNLYFDESQNVKLSLDRLYDCLIGKGKDNLDDACLITKIISQYGDAHK
jgi:predicted dehydrogenase